MANLLDTIRANSAPQQQGVQDETSKLQTLLRAKSGKAVGGSGVATSNLGEQQAVANTNQTIQQEVAPQAAIQNAGIQQQAQGQAQQEQLQRADITQARNLDTVQTRLKTDAMLNDLSRDKGKVDLAQNGARLEQLGQNIRLENKKYIDDLQREGQTARLNDDIGFKEANLRAQLGDNLEILNKSIDNNTILNANDRDFKKQVASIDIASAYAMFNNEMKAARETQMWSSIGALGTAGVGAAANYANKPATPVAAQPTTNMSGEQQTSTVADNSGSSRYSS